MKILHVGHTKTIELIEEEFKGVCTFKYINEFNIDEVDNYDIVVLDATYEIFYQVLCRHDNVYYSFTDRVSEEFTNERGEVEKKAILKHICFRKLPKLEKKDSFIEHNGFAMSTMAHTLSEDQMLDLNENWKVERIVKVDDNLHNKIVAGVKLDTYEQHLSAMKEAISYMPHNSLIVVQGEWGITAELVKYCYNNNYIPIYGVGAVSVEDVMVGDVVERKVIYKHKEFKRYL